MAQAQELIAMAATATATIVVGTMSRVTYDALTEAGFAPYQTESGYWLIPIG